MVHETQPRNVLSNHGNGEAVGLGMGLRVRSLNHINCDTKKTAMHEHNTPIETQHEVFGICMKCYNIMRELPNKTNTTTYNNTLQHIQGE